MLSTTTLSATSLLQSDDCALFLPDTQVQIITLTIVDGQCAAIVFDFDTSRTGSITLHDSDLLEVRE